MLKMAFAVRRPESTNKIVKLSQSMNFSHYPPAFAEISNSGQWSYHGNGDKVDPTYLTSLKF